MKKNQSTRKPKLNIDRILRIQAAHRIEYKKGYLAVTSEHVQVQPKVASQIAPLDQWKFRRINDPFQEFMVQAWGTLWITLVRTPEDLE
jgi:hypothetical protein